MARPSVDVVVPFAGSAEARAGLEQRIARLRVAEGDSVLIVDNSPQSHPARPGGVPVLHAPELRTPAFARNRGAAAGRAEWIVFLDTDVEPADDLLDRYLEPPPGARVGLLAGGLVDEPVQDGVPQPAAARWSAARMPMSQDTTFAHGRFGFAQTANCAVRRRAFEAVGGFREELRAGEDADLCYRLSAAGYAIERREAASAVHRSRKTLRALVAQQAIHGSGIAWIDRAYPGSFPPHRRPGLVWWALRHCAGELAGAARGRDRERAVLAVPELLTTLAFELGRSLPNERPLLRRPL
jgi:mycofactocin glycosyltransferase